MAVMCPNKELTDDIDELKGYVLEKESVLGAQGAMRNRKRGW